MARVFSSCGDGTRVSHVGAMLSRASDAVRVNVRGLTPDAIPTYLREAGWPGDPADVAEAIALAASMSKTITVVLDAGDRVAPWLALECLPAVRYGLEPDLVALLERFERAGFCSSRERDELAAWPGLERPTPGGPRWPAALIRDALLVPDDHFSAFGRFVSHVKIVYRPGEPLGAKAYLAFIHRWFRPTGEG
jgi:hypothetical protein